jgi:hypothetical protein
LQNLLTSSTLIKLSETTAEGKASATQKIVFKPQRHKGYKEKYIKRFLTLCDLCAFVVKKRNLCLISEKPTHS